MPDEKCQLIVHFTMQGLIRFLSHRETMDMFSRALKRANIPVVYSQGFNPRIRLTLPLPRTTGVETVGDMLCAELANTQPLDAGQLQQRLQEQLPAGCRITKTEMEIPARKWYPDRVQYRFAIKKIHEVSASLSEDAVARRAGEILSRSCVEVLRHSPKKPGPRAFDIRPFIERIDVWVDTVEAVCLVRQEGTVKVSELLSVLELTGQKLRRPIVRTVTAWRGN